MTQNILAIEIWEYVKKMGIHISAAHIPGKHNILADEASRKFQDAAEWKIDPKIFKSLVDMHGPPEIDLFASRLNYQLPTYVSWLPDPESAFIDAFSIKWTGRYIYAFPPFSMIWPVLSKIVEEKVERALVVVPKWPTQSWYTLINKLRIPGHPPTMISSSTSKDLMDRRFLLEKEKKEREKGRKKKKNKLARRGHTARPKKRGK